MNYISLRRRLCWWTFFSASFALVEALTVVYIRRQLGALPGESYRQLWKTWGLAFHSSEILGALRARGILALETCRELATLALLAGAAMAAGRTVREKIGLFLWAFASWDLFYYLWLRIYTGFPTRWDSTDIYYLVPIAWYGPVWFPILLVMPTLLAVAWRQLREENPQMAAAETPHDPTR